MAILNVDDTAASRFTRSRILERAGYDVREADSAAGAMADFLSEGTPDLVLLDVALPDGDGFTVCEQMKAVSPEVPVVMITTVYQKSHDRRDAFQGGADEYLLEPVEPSRLVDVVRHFLDAPHNATAISPPTIVTDDYGTIISANAAAARLLNLSPCALRARTILAFFSPDRERMAAHMRRAVAGCIVQQTVTVRPREKKPFTVRVDISLAPFERGGSLEWILEPVADRTSGVGSTAEPKLR
jgi:DNA-binding response OmpR family regulator